MAFLNVIPSYTAAGADLSVICSEDPVQNIESWFLLLVCRSRSNMPSQFKISSLLQTSFFVCVWVWISCLQFLLYWSTYTVQFNTKGKVNNESTKARTHTHWRESVSIKVNGLENFGSMFDLYLRTCNRYFAYELDYKSDNRTAVTAVQ